MIFRIVYNFIQNNGYKIWNLKITNIKITKDELFDVFIYEFIFFIFLNEIVTL